MHLAYIVVILLLTMSNAQSAAQKTANHQLDTPALDSFVTDHLQRTGIAGVAVAIVHGNSVALVKGYGRNSDGTLVTADTPMYVASVSKAFTALAVMQLMEAQLIELDSPVSKYLPEFYLADSRSQNITVRQLLGQRTGMSDAEFFEWENPGPTTLELAVTRMHGAHLSEEPGSRFIYHNPNYHVAARLIEVVSGKPFSQYMREHVFIPIGMNHTKTVTRIESQTDSVPIGHVYAFGRAFAVRQPEFFIAGAAGVVTTASDMAKWLITQSNDGLAPTGVRVLSKKGIEAMHSPSMPGASYGFGWFVTKSDWNTRLIHHNGWLPTFTAYDAIYPDEHYALAVLGNGGMTLGTGYEAISIAYGINAIEHGMKPTAFGENAFTVDAVLTIASILLLLLAVVANKRAKQWAQRRSAVARWRTGLRFLLSAIVLFIGICAPTIVGILFGGRAASWPWLFYLSPTLLMFCWSLIIYSGTALISRGFALLRHRPSLRGSFGHPQD